VRFIYDSEFGFDDKIEIGMQELHAIMLIGAIEPKHMQVLSTQKGQNR
jgi:hypothetical protein